MNYYPHHIGDFNNATRHLTRVERSLYRDLIELYYDTEQPLPATDIKALCKRVLASTDEEVEAVKAILNEFFERDGEVWRHPRCDNEINAFHLKHEAAVKAGKASAERRANRRSKSVKRPLNDSATNQEPITNNQEPITNKKTYSSDSVEIGLARRLFGFIRARNEKHKEPDWNGWAVQVDRLIRLDGRSVQEIGQVIDWCQRDEFWQNNILSTEKLREKFDMLVLKMRAGKKPEDDLSSVKALFAGAL